MITFLWEPAPGGFHISAKLFAFYIDLIVVEKLACLYDCAEDEMLCHVLVVIGRGASVVTLPTWNLAARNPNNVAPTRVIRHRPLAIQKRVTFVVDLQFQARAGAVMHVLEA